MVKYMVGGSDRVYITSNRDRARQANLEHNHPVAYAHFERWCPRSSYHEKRVTPWICYTWHEGIKKVEYFEVPVDITIGDRVHQWKFTFDKNTARQHYESGRPVRHIACWLERDGPKRESVHTYKRGTNTTSFYRVPNKNIDRR
jgi:hypothetical protein